MKQVLSNYDFEILKLDHLGRAEANGRGTARILVFNLSDTEQLTMVEVPGGDFQMGASSDELEARENESPTHLVHVPSFYLARFPITQLQWHSVMKSLPQIEEPFRGDALPVVNVWFEQALDFCVTLSRETTHVFRLPSEAEWEYACRAGTTLPFNFGETITTSFANFNGSKPYGESAAGEFRKRTTPCGELRNTNAFGLQDMHGNVWEWCADVWHDDYNGAPTDGSAWISGGDQGYRVQRGGSWRDPAGHCRSAFRVGDIAHNRDHLVGLRVCMTARRFL
jgi:formylglycine-generating enzyme required for sulfatase activity